MEWQTRFPGGEEKFHYRYHTRIYVDEKKVLLKPHKIKHGNAASKKYSQHKKGVLVYYNIRVKLEG